MTDLNILSHDGMTAYLGAYWRSWAPSFPTSLTSAERVKLTTERTIFCEHYARVTQMASAMVQSGVRGGAMEASVIQACNAMLLGSRELITRKYEVAAVFYLNTYNGVVTTLSQVALAMTLLKEVHTDCVSELDALRGMKEWSNGTAQC